MSDLPEPLTPPDTPDPEACLGTFKSIGWFLSQALDQIQEQALTEPVDRNQCEGHSYGK